MIDVDLEVGELENVSSGSEPWIQVEDVIYPYSNFPFACCFDRDPSKTIGPG